MIKGLAITPPVLGRISIGKVVEKNGKRLPEKDDQFTLTTQVQNRDGWLLHPYDERLRQSANGKLRTIPVRLMFNDPDLTLRAEYSIFDKTTGRPLCVGNGERCKRFTDQGVQTLPCPAPEGCSVGKGLCKPYGRLNVIIGDGDDLGSFIFRTTGYNSIRTLAARLRYLQAISGNRLSCLELDMRLRAKSTTQSHRAPVYFVDLTIREGMSLVEAVRAAIALDEHRRANGLNQDVLDAAASQGLANGSFEESVEELPEIVEEFFDDEALAEPPAMEAPAGASTAPSLKDKLNRKALASKNEPTDESRETATTKEV